MGRIPVKKLPFKSVPFDCAQDTHNDELASTALSQRVHSFQETTWDEVIRSLKATLGISIERTIFKLKLIQRSRIN
jgi:hypothetical protein